MSGELQLHSVKWVVTYVRLEFDAAEAKYLKDTEDVLTCRELDELVWRSPADFTSDVCTAARQTGLAGLVLLWLIETVAGSTFLDSGAVPDATSCQALSNPGVTTLTAAKSPAVTIASTSSSLQASSASVAASASPLAAKPAVSAAAGATAADDARGCGR